jgi:hypothetical protein
VRAVPLLLAGLVLASVAGVPFIARALNRGGLWQVGLWAGLLLIADAVLMFQYVRFLLPLAGPCLD